MNYISNILETSPRLVNFMVFVFDFGSAITSFFLFNPVIYLIFLLVFFFVLVCYSVELMEFFISIKNNNFASFFTEFFLLPFPLFTLFLFYFLFLELVILCTILASIPAVKNKMIALYNDPLILKKRGYNMLSSSIKRTVSLGLPLAAGFVVAGDHASHVASVNAILENNNRIIKLYADTRDARLLNQLQKIPTDRISERAHNATIGFKNFLIEWSTGAKTKD